MTLTIVPASGPLLEQWRAVHNDVIRPTQLTGEEVVELALRNYLTLAYDDVTLVGNATVRAARDGEVTVIVRILHEYRRRGFGSEYLGAMVKYAHASQVQKINTIVLVDNVEGLAFAIRHGFAEIERYEMSGTDFIELTLDGTSVPALTE